MFFKSHNQIYFTVTIFCSWTLRDYIPSSYFENDPLPLNTQLMSITVKTWAWTSRQRCIRPWHLTWTVLGPLLVTALKPWKDNSAENWEMWLTGWMHCLLLLMSPPFLPFVEMTQNEAGIMSGLPCCEPTVSEARHKSQADHPCQVNWYSKRERERKKKKLHARKSRWLGQQKREENAN